jgi:hypothetical protein
MRTHTKQVYAVKYQPHPRNDSVLESAPEIPDLALSSGVSPLLLARYYFQPPLPRIRSLP